MGSETRVVDVPIAGFRAALALHSGADKACATVLALHGFTGSGADFLPLIEAIGRDRLHWVCPDFMGHGSSDSPRNLDPYLLANTLKLVDAARHAAPNPDRVILLGYSMGGRIALNYLRWSAPLPAVVIGASPGLRDPEERRQRRIRDARWIAEGTRIDEFCRNWEAQPLILPQTRLPEPLKSQLAARRRKNDLTGLKQSLLALGSGALPDLWTALPALPPVTCLYGEQDAGFAREAQLMQQENPRFTPVAVPGCGHAPHLEAPDDLASLLADLLLSR